MVSRNCQSPSLLAYKPWLQAYEHLSLELFDGLLPEVVISFERRTRCISELKMKKWSTTNNTLFNQITLNPEYFKRFPVIELLLPMALDMATIWQHQFGQPSVSGFTNLEKAEKLKTIGIISSSTSLPGGSFVGHHNCAYIIYDGLFFRAVKSLLLKGFKIELYDRYPIYRPNAPILTYDNDGREIPITESCSRMRDLTEYRYICTNCEEELFCSSELKVKCGKCDEAFVLDNFQSLNTSFN